MRKQNLAIVMAGLFVAGRVSAGSLDPTNAPGPTMHTLEEIYQKVQSLDPETQQVLSETTAAVNAGYYAATNLTQVDADLAAANIKAGTTIFGVAGKTEVVDTMSGDAAAGDVLSGKKVWVDGVEVSGAMGTQTLSPASADVSSGYYATTNLTQVDADLVAGNIKTNVTIFGIVGTLGTNAGGNTYSAAVPKTGQTNSYAANDDGAYQKGVTLPNPRFTVQADTNCVLDNLTGLIWARNANLTGTMTWPNAIVYCENLNYGGQTDWRLPNLRELLSLVDFSRNAPALPTGHPFAGVQFSYYYWSGTSVAGITGSARVVDMTYGIAGYYDKAYNLVCVWPVRGGQ